MTAWRSGFGEFGFDDVADDFAFGAHAVGEQAMLNDFHDGSHVFGAGALATRVVGDVLDGSEDDGTDFVFAGGSGHVGFDEPNFYLLFGG